MTKEEFEKEKILYKHSDTKYVVIDGAGIESYEQYFDKLWEAFGFGEIPEGWKKDYHTEDVFMTEMDELPENKYVFVIKNYLLPFWDEEVLTTVVGGKRKDFNIYLVSNK